MTKVSTSQELTCEMVNKYAISLQYACSKRKQKSKSQMKGSC